MRKRTLRHPAHSLELARSGRLKFDEQQVVAFSQQISGRVVLPHDPSYAVDRQPFMCAFHHYPQIIVYCDVFADVVAAIRFARETGLTITCRAGGHSAAGYSVNDEMVIDLSGIHHVLVDPDEQTARVGGGTHFGQLYPQLDLYGLHLPGGGCPTVSVGGYMQGGGYSFTSLMFGMNCDSVLGVTVALADGRIVNADETEHSDLYWAVRGGTGNNFGAVLEIRYRLRPLGDLWGFGFKWPIRNDAEIDAASQAAASWHRHYTGANAPDHLGTQSQLVFTREEPAAKESHPFFVVRGLYNGSEAACLELLAPFLAEAPDAARRRDIWQAGSYTELNGYLLNYPTEMPDNVPFSARSIAKSHITDQHLSAEQWRDIVAFFSRTPSRDNFIGLEAYGNAINAVDPSATAFWHRRGTLDVFLYSFWIQDECREEAEAYMDEFDRVLAPYANGHSYQNYPNRNNVDFGRMYFGGNLERLVEVKKRYDPDDLFSFEQGLLKA